MAQLLLKELDYFIIETEEGETIEDAMVRIHSMNQYDRMQAGHCIYHEYTLSELEEEVGGLE